MKYNARQLAIHLDTTEEHITFRAELENWRFERVCSDKYYAFDDLPLELQSATICSIVADQAEAVDFDDDDYQGAGQVDPIFNHVYLWDFLCLDLPTESIYRVEFYKLALLKTAQFYSSQNNTGKFKGFELFSQLYCARTFDIDPRFYTIIPTLSKIMLLRWQKNESELLEAAQRPMTEVDEISENTQQLISILLKTELIDAKQLYLIFRFLYEHSSLPSFKVLKLYIEKNAPVDNPNEDKIRSIDQTEVSEDNAYTECPFCHCLTKEAKVSAI